MAAVDSFQRESEVLSRRRMNRSRVHSHCVLHCRHVTINSGLTARPRQALWGNVRCDVTQFDSHINEFPPDFNDFDRPYDQLIERYFVASIPTIQKVRRIRMGDEQTI